MNLGILSRSVTLRPRSQLWSHGPRRYLRTRPVFQRLKYVWALAIVTPIVGLAAMESVHFYVERFSLPPSTENNDDIRRWEWHHDCEHWNPDPEASGTDPALGRSAAHAIRSAWIAQHFHRSEGDAVATTIRSTGFLYRAIAYIEAQTAAAAASDSAEQKLHPHLLPETITLCASILEQGGPQFWAHSRAAYHLAFPMFAHSNHPIRTAQIALRLGDLDSRLGGEAESSVDPLQWWKRSVEICTGQTNLSDDPLTWIPTTTKKQTVGQQIVSPALQRIYTSVLVSASAYLASKGQLELALKLDTKALNFLRTIPTPPSVASASPSETLHHLYLLHRSSLLSIHAAEISYFSTKSSPSISLQWLQSVIQSSDRILKTLSQEPPNNNNSDNNDTLHRPALPALRDPYPTSPLLQSIAKQLIQDACTANAEAHNLIGLLEEQSNPKSAANHFTQAVWWSSLSDPSGNPQPAPGIMRTQWNSIMDNFKRTSQPISKSPSDTPKRMAG